MGFLLRFFIVFALLAPLNLIAQTFQYRLEGSFVSNSVTINYGINWNETDSRIQGIYQDNYYAGTIAKTVTGTIDSTGRTFNIILPEVTNNVKLITLKLSQSGLASGSLPIHIETYDSINRNIATADSFAFMTRLITPPVTDTSCTVGFGLLTGLCGLYGGNFNELTDSQNRCNLVVAGQPRLELGTDTNFTLYLNYVGTLEGIPFHSLGTFIASPLTGTVTIQRENCGELPATTFDPANCQTQVLNANFFESVGVAKVSGSYVITDQVTNESCSYRFFLSREVLY